MGHCALGIVFRLDDYSMTVATSAYSTYVNIQNPPFFVAGIQHIYHIIEIASLQLVSQPCFMENLII